MDFSKLDAIMMRSKWQQFWFYGTVTNRTLIGLDNYILSLTLLDDTNNNISAYS